MLPSKSGSHCPKPKKTGTESFEISLYEGDLPDKEELKLATVRLSIAFPKMSKEFFVLLSEFIIKQEFTSKRLSDAVNFVIANFNYKELNIADIIRFDRRVKLYTGSEFMTAQSNGRRAEDFERREIDGVMFRVLKEDLIREGLK